jgi:hypothetical protein
MFTPFVGKTKSIGGDESSKTSRSIRHVSKLVLPKTAAKGDFSKNAILNIDNISGFVSQKCRAAFRKWIQSKP